MLISYFSDCLFFVSGLQVRCIPQTHGPAEMYQTETGCQCLFLPEFPARGLCCHQDWLSLVLQEAKPKRI